MLLKTEQECLLEVKSETKQNNRFIKE